MNRDSGEFRRLNKQPSYKHMSRYDYVLMAGSFATKANRTLDNEVVLKIRENRKGHPARVLAEMYGVSKTTIYRILNRETYIDVR